MTTPVKRTMMAQQALETSDLLNLRFASRVVGHTVKRKLMVAAPEQRRRQKSAPVDRVRPRE